MPKMIKVTYTKPSEDVEWHYPLTSYSGYAGIAEDIKTSHANFKTQTEYTSAPADAPLKVQTVVNSPNNLSLERYMLFSDYPETTPSNLEAWFISKTRAYEKTIADNTITGTNPLSPDENITVSVNKGMRWVSKYMIENGICVSSIQEVDHDFPA